MTNDETYDLFEGELPSGEQVLYVTPTIPDDAPPRIREGIARRRIVSRTGQCPCGARIRFPNRAERRAAAKAGLPATATVEHEPDCPAGEEVYQWAEERGLR
jgi:hypothetical protein